MKNRFNNITSKEWLPFQKSWFIYQDYESLIRANIRFFVKFDNPELDPNVLFYGKEGHETVKKIAAGEGANVFFEKDIIKEIQYQFIIIDLLSLIDQNTTVDEYQEIKQNVFRFLGNAKGKLYERRFVNIFVKNVQTKIGFLPFAWDLAKNLSGCLSLKDEKIACLQKKAAAGEDDYFRTDDSVFYALYFRKDEHSEDDCQAGDFIYSSGKTAEALPALRFNAFPSWQIVKPRPRKKNEILHPAKYPEELIKQFINTFSKEGENIFDPMSGTGSTQVAALELNRNGYGTELSPFFAKIARQRCEEVVHPLEPQLFEKAPVNLRYKILLKNAKETALQDFPTIDYMITSPPYWDMLNMKGAEYQARRKEKGLQLNYSEDPNDLGNIGNYQAFLDELEDVYVKILQLLKKGSYFTIIVKNIKKKGHNYPFAWDLSARLQKHLLLLPEVFWLQDDISIAPYGYGNTWVSNTFHQYCLTFRKVDD